MNLSGNSEREKMEQINILSQSSSIILTLFISAIFVILGIVYSNKFKGLNNYLVANRSIGTFSLTTSLIASALGAWILFGPASAATWGGIGAVIGYSCGTAAPMLFLLNFGPKIRKEFPKGMSITDFVKKRFGLEILKIIIILILFYLTIFLIAEVTAIAFLLNLVSNTPLWITSGLTLITCLLYVLKGGFKLSIITDKYQFSIIVVLIFFSLFLILNNLEMNSYKLISKNVPNLLSEKNFVNYTAGLTFFIAVAATNLFHQGNWQRVYSAKSNDVLKKSLIISFIIIIPVVFLMGFSGLIAISQNSSVIPDLAFFSLLLKEQTILLSIIILMLALSLTISSIDTLINAISSLIVVDGNRVIKFKGNYLNL